MALNFGFDAVSTWIHGFDSADKPSRISRGVYGAEVGVPRILDVLDDHEVVATFFTPGHTIESFPGKVGEIIDRGHELQCHGWKHQSPLSFNSREDEQADIERAIDAIVDICGEKPTGYRSPTGDFSRWTYEILEELGFTFDSSLLGNDFEPYYLRENALGTAPVDEPYDPGGETEMIEIPFKWFHTEFPVFTHIWSDPYRVGYGDESVFFGRWYDAFDWMYEHRDNGLFLPILHPQVSGQPSILSEFDRFLEYVSERPGVEFETMSTVASTFDANNESYG